MDDNNAYILSLIKKFEQGRASDTEMHELEAWFQSFEHNPNITEGFSPEQRFKAKAALFSRINESIDRELDIPPPRRQAKQVSIFARLMIAASILIAVSVSAYFFLRQQKPVEQTAENLTTDFAPGNNKAMLTLGNGQKIVLTGAKNGRLATQGNVVINKTADGEVVYGSDGKNEAIAMNTMTTPRGGSYHLTLSDGTGVWLNASSSIKYPTAFTGTGREVEISGEVYFEVAHNAQMPFRVKTGTQTVEVLGTHFNINGYDKPVKTTLLEGSIALAAGDLKKVIKPGQQAMVMPGDIRTQRVDVDEIVAWKDGFFDFTDADIQTVMREFSRWYDIDVVFDGPVTTETFTGRIPRSWSFAKVLKLSKSFKSIHLTIEGRRVMVKQ